MLALSFGGVMGLLASLHALGEAKLRRGIGVLARWQVPAAEWEAFRAFDARREAEHARLIGHYTPHPAEGRAVEVLFGQRQVIVDQSYHPLSRMALPELTWMQWHEPKDAPECLEFGVLYPGGRYGGAKPMAVRVPVARAAREEGVRVWHHFHARMPKARQALLFRYPRRVIGGCLAVLLLGAAVAVGAWLLHPGGNACGLAEGVMALGIGVASFAGLVMLILGLVLLASRLRGDQRG
jgi:hypothetical protein